MGKLSRLGIISLLFLSQLSFALNAADIPGLVKNLTDAINRFDQHSHNVTEFVEKNWPAIEEYLASIANLPEAIRSLDDAVNNAMPIVQKCTFYLGGCIVVAGFLLAVPNILRFCRESNRYQAIPSEEEGFPQ